MIFFMIHSMYCLIFLSFSLTHSLILSLSPLFQNIFIFLLYNFLYFTALSLDCIPPQMDVVNLMMRLHFWGFEECEIALHSYYSQVHSHMEW